MPRPKFDDDSGGVVCDNNVEIPMLELERGEDDSDNDKEELQGLLPVGNARQKNHFDQKFEAHRAIPQNKWYHTICTGKRKLGIFALTTLLVLAITGWSVEFLLSPLHLSNSPKKPLLLLEQDNRTSLVQYKCPASIAKAANDKDDNFDYYNKDTKIHAQATGDISLEGLLDIKYGAWGITPRQRKALNARWVHWYAEAIQQARTRNSSSNDRTTIYESACGVGLTLFVILQLLQEQCNITGLEVYGNEYILDDVVTANQFYDNQEEHNAALQLKRGRICHGDSTNLTFVPSNAFDIVMTGYIDPIVDPLNLHWHTHEYKNYCKSTEEKYQQLVAKDQSLVEDWFASWAGEMIRVAKPGGTIIIESISQPRCLVRDWGGVAKDWWANVAVFKYDWSEDIDPTTIEILDFDPEKHYKGIHDRYNLRMVKKGK